MRVADPSRDPLFRTEDDHLHRCEHPDQQHRSKPLGASWYPMTLRCGGGP
jgi:hypothetical protein